jgi:hypothetical protein
MTYKEKLEYFRALLERQHNERLKRLYPNASYEPVGVEEGYKFDKVFTILPRGIKIGRYMVESRTGIIYGIKSWTQVNRRRQYGTLDTVDQYSWDDGARPLPGTEAEKLHVEREAKIKAAQKKRGRRPKSQLLKP